MDLRINILVLTCLLSCGGASAQVAIASQIGTELRRKVGVREPVQYVIIDGVRLAYSDPDSRSALPIVIALHAIGHGGRDFEAVRKHFARKYRIITLDWPGQGNSGSDHEAASVSRYTKLFTNFIKKQNLDHFVILGNSIGGGVAIKYAAENPRKVKALILSNPAGLDEGGFFAKIFIWWIEGKMRSGTSMDESFYEWFKDYYHEVLITDRAAPQRDRIIASGYEIAPILEQAWHSFRQPEGDLRDLIPKIKLPVLFAWAKDDSYVQWSRCREAVETFENKKVEFFKAGHAPFLETPDEFNALAEHFLDSLGS
jgi:pimeloyl-ACP methyl ester carboxylesterase